MGVTGLWQHLKPAAEEKSFESIALDIFDEAYQGQEIDPNRLLGLRVGTGSYTSIRPRLIAI